MFPKVGLANSKLSVKEFGLFLIGSFSSQETSVTVPFPSTARDFVPQEMLFFSNTYADSTIFSTHI